MPPTGLLVGRDNRGQSVLQQIYAAGPGDDQGAPYYELGYVPRPDAVLGAYYVSSITGTMAAGIGGASPIFALRWAPTTPNTLCLVRHCVLSVTSLGTGFTAGLGTFNLFVARAFTANDTGGGAAVLTTNQGKLRTSFATSLMADLRIATTAALGAGTRTLDALPIARQNFNITVATNTTFLNVIDMLNRGAVSADWPVVLANNEGLELQATVPATGTWQATVDVGWEELAAY